MYFCIYIYIYIFIIPIGDIFSSPSLPPPSTATTVTLQRAATSLSRQHTAVVMTPVRTTIVLSVSFSYFEGLSGIVYIMYISVRKTETYHQSYSVAYMYATFRLMIWYPDIPYHQSDFLTPNLPTIFFFETTFSDNYIFRRSNILKN